VNPKISIIVPIFNVEPYIRQCVDSILKQTFTNFELILVNDGSTDNSGDICEQYAKQDRRVIVLHKKNEGQSSARNAGLDIASGDYIGFVDGDDYIHERMYEILYSEAELHRSDMIICELMNVEIGQWCNTKNLDCNYSINHYTNLQALNQLYKPINGRFDTMGNACEGWIFPVIKLYKRYLFNELRFEKGRIYEDEFIIHKLLYNCSKITTISAILYFYVQRPDSTVGSPFTTKKFDKVYALQDRAEFFQDIKQKDLHDKAIKCFFEVLLWYYFSAKSMLSNVDSDLKELRGSVKKNFKSLTKNPYLNWKQKAMLILFKFNPYVFEKIKNVKEKYSSVM